MSKDKSVITVTEKLHLVDWLLVSKMGRGLIDKIRILSYSCTHEK